MVSRDTDIGQDQVGIVSSSNDQSSKIKAEKSVPVTGAVDDEFWHHEQYTRSC